MNRITVNQGDSLAAKLTTANTSYEMSGAIDLSGGTVLVPPSCTLKFEEGTKITNGTLVLNNTVFEGAKHSIRTIVSGTQYELDTDDFDLTDDDKADIMQSIVNTATVIQLHGKLENVFDNITIENNTEFTGNPNDHVEKPKIIIGNGATIVNTSNSSSVHAAIYIKTNDLIRITNLNFEIKKGWAIKKDTVTREADTRLSFIIDRCRFKKTAANSYALIRLTNSREGNITNCFFEGKNTGTGIYRANAVNTNVIGCMFKKLSYGIEAVAVHTDGDGNDQYSSYACGLNVQSAIILGCTYGIFIEGNDSFFLNNSMIDFCTNPLVIISQDGANITNNYFSTSTSSGTYNAVITLRNNPDKTSANENKRIIISGNTIYGHRTTNCYGIDMDVDSIDCTIQGNTFDYFHPDGIILRPHGNPNDNWAIEKLVIDNNRFHFGGLANSNVNMYAIRGDNFTGDEPVIITNNYVMESKKNNVTPQITTKFMAPESSYFGNYLSFGNHDYLESVPAGDYGNQNFYASRINHSRMKFELYMGEAVTQIALNNPMPGEQKLVVYIANNPCPINVDMSHILDSNSRIIFNRAASNEVITFTAIVERTYNL